MVDRWDEQLHLRCQGFTTDAAAILSGEAPPQAAAQPSGAGGAPADVQRAMRVASDFKIGGILALLHLQPFDGNLKQKVSTGLLSQLEIPDTVAFCAGDPAYPCWYITSKADPGTIKRKNSCNLTPRNIVEAFTKRRKRSVHKGLSGIVAVLVSDARPNAGISETDEVGEAQCEYLDEMGLRHFLDKRVASFSGILQKWVDPKGAHNSQLHCLWGSSLCQVTCKTNTRALSDRRCSMYDRAVTFDGAESHTQRDPVSAQMQECVQQACANMVAHVARMTEGKCRITSLSSYWKVRPDGRVVFLWCSALRTTTSGAEAAGAPPVLPSRAYSPLLSVPHEVDAQMPPEHSRPYVCPVSDKVLGAHDARHFITYKMIVAEWDATRMGGGAARPRPSSAGFRPMSAQTPRQPPPSEAPAQKRPSSARVLSRRTVVGAESEAIPPLIRKLESLSDESLYRRLLTDAAFLYKQVRVTEDVAHRFSRHVETAEQLDRDLLRGGGGGVAIVPNTEPPARAGGASRASARSGASPFVDIMGDDGHADGVPALPLWRLSPPKPPAGEPGARTGRLSARTRRSSVSSSAHSTERSADDFLAKFRAGLRPAEDYYSEALVSPPKRRRGAGSGGAGFAQIQARSTAAAERHKKRLKAAKEEEARRKDFRAGALQCKPPAPPPKPRAGTAAHLLAEGRRVGAGPRIAASLKALVVPQLHLARLGGTGLSDDDERPQADKENSARGAQQQQQPAGRLSGRAPVAPLWPHSGAPPLHDGPRARAPLLAPGASPVRALGLVAAGRQQRKVMRLQEELETHVTAHSEHTRVVHGLMELARQQFALPPVGHNPARRQFQPPPPGRRSAGQREEDQGAGGCGEGEGEEELGEAPREWRGGGAGLAILQEAQKAPDDSQGGGGGGDGDGGSSDGGETSEGPSQDDDDADGASARRDEDEDADSVGGRWAPPAFHEEDAVRDEVMGNLLGSLDPKEQGYFLQVLQAGHCL